MKNKIIKYFLLGSLLAQLTPSVFAKTEPSGFIGVANKEDGTAEFIDAKLMKSVSKVTVGHLPHEIAAVPNSTLAFVSNYGKIHVTSNSSRNRPGNTLSVIDLSSQNKVSELSLGEGTCAPHGIMASDDGKTVFVTCEGTGTIVAINPFTLKILYKIETGQDQSHLITLSKDGKRAYVANFGPGTISILDLKSRQSIKHIKVGLGTEGIDVSSDHKFIYATAREGNQLVKIDAVSLKVIKRVDTEKAPIRVIITPDGKKLAVNCAESGTFQLYEAETLKLIKSIKVGKLPIGLIVPSNNFAYVANMNSNSISEISLKKLQVTRTVSTGMKPDGMTFIQKI